MAEWQLYQLTDLRELLSTSSNIIVTDLVEVVLLVLTVERITLAKDDSVLCNDTALWWVKLDNLELCLFLERRSDGKDVANVYWSVCFQKVLLEVNLEEVTGETFDGVGNWKY
jgi:hypothetical protein